METPGDIDVKSPTSRPIKHAYWLLKTGYGHWLQDHAEAENKSKPIYFWMVPPEEVSKGPDNVCPEYTRVFMEELRLTREGDMQRFVDTLRHSGLKDFISRYCYPGVVEGLSTTMVKRNLALIGRFSFRTYAMSDAEA
jgi:hypothetical protein